MKSNFIFAALASLVIVTSACKKPEDPAVKDDDKKPAENITLAVENKPSAKAEDDNKSSGIYKGTFVGSSGTFKLIIQPNDISGIITVDGKTYKLTTDDISSANLGSAINNAEFTDASNTIKLTFSVAADGSNPTVAIVITSHTDVKATVFKETSQHQVKVYEGYTYYTYQEDGIQCIYHLNVLLGRDTLAKAASRYSETKDLPGSSNGEECDMENWTNDYTYILNNNKINIYRWVRESGTSVVKDYLFGRDINFSDAQIQSVDGADSIRLIRKL